MFRPLVFMAAFSAGLLSSFDPPNMLPALDHALRRFSDTSLAFIEKSLTPVKAETEPIDTRAAANLDEDLDWRMAKTADGLRAFLAKHPNGKHARDAQAELDKLTKPTGPPPAPQAPKFAPVVEVANARPPAPDFFAVLERPPPPETKVLEVERTVVKWREQQTRYVTWRRYERPRYVRRPPPPPPLFLALFGPPPGPHAWRGAPIGSCFVDWRCRGQHPVSSRQTK